MPADKTGAILKRCPFCGGQAIIKPAPFGDGGFVVGCSHDAAADPVCAPSRRKGHHSSLRRRQLVKGLEYEGSMKPDTATQFPRRFKPPSGPVTPDYRRGIEDAARMMEEWATVAKGEKRIAYDNARIGILAMLGQMERSTK
jgi:hypothetical protein